MRAAAAAAFRAEIENPVGAFNHLEIVLDDDERIAGVAQLHEHFEQLVDIGKMQAGGRLIEDVNGAPGGLLGQLGGELDALRFAAGKRGAALPEPHVAEPHVLQREQLVGNLRDIAKEARGLIHRHIEHVGDVLALVSDLERLAIVAPAVADLALHIDVGQKVHLDLLHPLAFARLAAPAFDIEGKAPGVVAADARRGQPGEEIADRLQTRRCRSTGFERGVRPIGVWSMTIALSICSSPWIDRMPPRPILRAVEIAEQRAPQDVIDQRRFAASRRRR